MASGPDPTAYTEKEEVGQQAQPQQPGLVAAQPLPPGYISGGAVPIQYMIPTTGTGFQVSATQKPAYPAPHSFMLVVLMTTVLCAIVNIFSLTFGIPAVVLVALSMYAKSRGNYPKAKRYGNRALYFVVCNLIFTLFVSLLIIAVLVCFPGRDRTKCWDGVLFINQERGWRGSSHA